MCLPPGAHGSPGTAAAIPSPALSFSTCSPCCCQAKLSDVLAIWVMLPLSQKLKAPCAAHGWILHPHRPVCKGLCSPAPPRLSSQACLKPSLQTALDLLCAAHSFAAHFPNCRLSLSLRRPSQLAQRLWSLHQTPLLTPSPRGLLSEWLFPSLQTLPIGGFLTSQCSRCH